MPAYEICYLEDDGALACAFSIQFESAMRAKILAHAMKPADCRRLEVWEGRTLVYQRPDALDDPASPATRAGMTQEASQPLSPNAVRRPNKPPRALSNPSA